MILLKDTSLSNEYIFSFLKNYVESKKIFLNNDIDFTFDYEEIIPDFINKVENEFNTDILFSKLLLSCYIPDEFMENGSEEKLYTKLVEVLIAIWAKKMGFEYEIIAEKSGKEDIRIIIGNEVVVADSKTFRLGRSQVAPNVKDFLKLASVSLWIENCNLEFQSKLLDRKAIGGLVTYTSLHEWKNKSEVYIECSDKNTPTLMLSYEYLSFLLLYKNQYNVFELNKLWDYNRIFKNKLPKENNKHLYWTAINDEIIKITNVNKEFLEQFLDESRLFVQEYCKFYLKVLDEEKLNLIENITREVYEIENIKLLRDSYIEYRSKIEIKNLIKTIERIENYRLK